MGVTKLWKILDEMGLAEKKDLNFLSGKRVAVDLSGWIVQAMLCPGLNQSKNPHLRNLFFRAKKLLKNGIFPIFILEGKMPSLKEAVFKKRNHQGTFQSENITRTKFDNVLKECEKFLKSLGVPCMKSSGEAEALCAFLYTKNIVDGVITEDSDAFLYGADTVLRDFSGDKKDSHVKQYSLKSTNNTLGLDQPKLIALALLLGCDYDKEGVPGIGPENALKLLDELKEYDLIQRFKDWKERSESELFPGYDSTVKKQGAHCKQCSHLGTLLNHKNSGCTMCNSQTECYLAVDGKNPCSCAWHKTQEIQAHHKVELKVYHAAKKLPDFPNLQIVQEFKNYTDSIPEENLLEWNCPELKEFQDKALNYFSWTLEYSHENVFPLITIWQQLKLVKDPSFDKRMFSYKPIKIVKQRTENFIKCFEVQWSHNDDNTSDFAVENLVTLETEERFEKAYPELSEQFYNSMKKSKNEAKSPKKKVANSKEKNRKVIQDPPVDSLPNLTPIQHNQSHVFDSSVNDSSDSFSYLPLCERILIISKRFANDRIQPSDYRTTGMDIPHTPAKSPILSNCKVVPPVSFPCYENKDVSFCPISNQVLHDKVDSLTEEVKELKISHLDSKCGSYHYIDLETNSDKPFLCLEFSDSDESYVDVLQNDSKSFYNLNYDSIRKTSVLVNNTESSLEDNLTDLNDCLKNHSEFLNASTDTQQHKNSKVIYCLKESSPANFAYRNFSANCYNSFCNSTPKNSLRKSILNKMLHLSTHKASPLNCDSSLRLYSPVIFDSSLDDSICLK